jgi:hypothetical protein
MPVAATAKSGSVFGFKPGSQRPQSYPEDGVVPDSEGEVDRNNGVSGDQTTLEGAQGLFSYILIFCVTYSGKFLVLTRFHRTKKSAGLSRSCMRHNKGLAGLSLLVSLPLIDTQSIYEIHCRR